MTARLTLAFGFLGLVTAFAQFTPISTPDSTYTSGTTLLAITGNNGTTTGSVSDGTQTATFSNNLTIATVGVSGWSTWNTPPNAETATPRVVAAYSTLTSFTITLSSPTNTFGFEAESNTFGTFSFTAEFFNGATSLGTVTRSVAGSSGSLLFAASSGTPITSVVLTTPSGANGFAIGQLRYAAAAPTPTPVPVPGTLILGGLGILAVAGQRLLARRRVTPA